MAKRTEELYLKITDALSFRYYRPGSRAAGKPNPVALRAEYAQNGLATLAEWYDVSVPTVRGWLVEYGIPLRNKGEKVQPTEPTTLTQPPAPEADVPHS